MAWERGKACGLRGKRFVAEESVTYILAIALGIITSIDRVLVMGSRVEI